MVDSWSLRLNYNIDGGKALVVTVGIYIPTDDLQYGDNSFE